MKRDMKSWILELRDSKIKKSLPILSFPCISLLGINVKELLMSADRQAEGMRLVAERTNSAASVSLMDLSVEAECFGAEIHISDTEVPTITGRLVHDMDEAEALAVPSIGTARTGICIEAIGKAAEMITDRPVFSGIIGPFSLAARLLDVSEIMADCYDDPDMVHVVLEKATSFLIAYAQAFKDAGANGVIVAEPVAGLLSPALEEEFSSPYMKKIVDSVCDDSFILIYHNCGDNTPRMLDSILSIGAAAYHFGNSIDMRAILEAVPPDTVVMGNVDPSGIIRMSDPETVRKATLSLMEKCCKYSNFVISSGCDIPPMTPWENIQAFYAAIDEYYGK